MSARPVVSVQGCWSEEAFTPGSGRPGRGRGGHLLSRRHGSAPVHPRQPPSAAGRGRSPRPQVQGPHTAGRCSGWTGSSRQRPGPVAIRRGVGTPSGGRGHHLGASDRLCGVRGPRYLSGVAAIAPINTLGGARMSGPRRLGVWRLPTGCREPWGPRLDRGLSQVTGSGVRPLTTTRQVGHHPHIEQKSRNNLSWGPGCCPSPWLSAGSGVGSVREWRRASAWEWPAPA